MHVPWPRRGGVLLLETPPGSRLRRTEKYGVPYKGEWVVESRDCSLEE